MKKHVARALLSGILLLPVCGCVFAQSVGTDEVRKKLADDLEAYRDTADVRRVDAAQAMADELLAKGVPTDGTTVRCFIELSTYFPPDVARKYRSAVKAAYAALPDDDAEKKKATDILKAFANRRKADAAVAALLPEKPRGWKMNERVTDWAEAILKQPLCKSLDELYAECQKEGKPFVIKSAHHDVISRIRCLAEAELCEKKGRFLGKLDEYIRLYSGQRAWCCYAYRNSDRYGNPPGRIQFPDLEATHFAADLGNVLWHLGDRLPPETVRLAKQAIERRIFQPARREIPMFANQGMGGKGVPWKGSFLYWIEGHSNWNAVCWNGLVHAALVTLDDPEDRAYFVRAAINSIPDYLAGLTSEGYCVEGPSYWNYGFGHHLRMGLFLREQTGGKLDIFTWPRQRACAEYGWKFVLSGELAPPYADASAISRPAKDILDKCRAIWPGIDRDPGNFTEYPEAQVWLFRNEKGYSISFKGGHNDEIHNNNDLGTYSIMRNGRIVGGEPGCEVYTDRTWSEHRYDSYVLSSYGHAVPVVGGQQQKAGRKYAAKLFARDVDGPVKSVTLELKDAYPVDTLKSLKRTCRYDSTTGEAVITDHVEFTEPSAFEDAYNLFRQEDNDSFKKENWKFIEWDVRPEIVVRKGGAYEVSEKTLTNPGALTPRRVAITFKDKVTEAEVEFRYRPGGDGAQ